MFYFSHVFNVNDDSPLDQNAFNVLPTFLQGSPYGGYDGYCLMGITDLASGGASSIDTDLTFLFDITNIFSFISNDIYKFGSFDADLNWKCLKPCPNSTYYQTFFGTCEDCPIEC